MMTTNLKRQNIALRPLKASDAASLQKYPTPNISQNTSPTSPISYPYTLDHARRWITKSQRLARQKKQYHFGIADAKTDDIIGMIRLRAINLHDKNAELGYWLGKPFWNKGYTTEAIRLILDFAFKELGLIRVYAVVHSQNVASYRVLEKCGFMREGAWRKGSRLGRMWHDVYAYGILKEEFHPAR